MQDLALRTVIKCDLAKTEIFEVCTVPEGIQFDEEAVHRVARRLEQQWVQCRDCVDVLFTRLWCHRLLHMGSGTCREAHSSLCDILALLRCTSMSVELKHLVGQGLKTKKEGAGATCDQVCRIVFRKSITQAAEACRQDVKAEVLGRRKETTNHFSMAIGGIATSGHLDRRSKANDGNASAMPRCRSLSSLESLKKRPKRGLGVFAKASYHEGIEAGGDHPFGKRKLLTATWGSLSEEQKSVFNAAAENVNDEEAEYEGEYFVEFLCRTAGAIMSQPSKRCRGNVKDTLRAVRVSVGENINSETFSPGTQLHDFQNGFNAENIRKDLKQATVNTYSKDIFGDDHVPVQNPRRMHLSRPAERDVEGFAASGICCRACRI